MSVSHTIQSTFLNLERKFANKESIISRSTRNFSTLRSENQTERWIFFNYLNYFQHCNLYLLSCNYNFRVVTGFVKKKMFPCTSELVVWRNIFIPYPARLNRSSFSTSEFQNRISKFHFVHFLISPFKKKNQKLVHRYLNVFVKIHNILIS